MSKPDHVRVLEAWAKKGYEVEERFPLCGFVYFGPKEETKRVFWSMKPEDEVTPNLSLNAGWGLPTDKERETVIRVLTEFWMALWRSPEAMKARNIPTGV
jgi:hypothetical protein